MLASLLYPYDDDAKKHIDGWLDQLSSEGCIARYEVDGTAYLQILNWASHQKIDKPSPSKLPEFVEPSRKFANPLEPSALDQEGNGEEGNGSGDSATPQSVEPPSLTLTLNDKSEHPVYPSSIAEWQATYPGVNVPQQLREMKAWCTANPTNRKTKRGIEAFIVRWLGKEQDKSGQQPRFSSPVGVTVPGREGRDPALLKIEEDSKRAAPIPASILEKLNALKGNGVNA